MTTKCDLGPVVTAGILLGIGMGGFIDGIVLHQILQLHNMLSAKLPPNTLVNVKVNMVWDGLFHLGTWIVTAVGLALLWKAGQRRDVAWVTRGFVGSLLLGWGLFNVMEGLIDHHVLHVHHVVEALGVSAYDYAFLGGSVVLMLVGWGQIRAGYAEAAQPSHDGAEGETNRAA
jgi:uncharacterized membrane protein